MNFGESETGNDATGVNNSMSKLTCDACIAVLGAESRRVTVTVSVSHRATGSVTVRRPSTVTVGQGPARAWRSRWAWSRLVRNGQARASVSRLAEPLIDSVKFKLSWSRPGRAGPGIR